MKKLNCNSLMELPVDEALLQKTLAIPQTADKKAVIPLLRVRAIAAAACLMLISAVSLAVILTFGTKAPVPVSVQAPSSSESTIPTTEPDESADPLPTEAPTPTQAGDEVAPSVSHRDKPSDDLSTSDRHPSAPNETKADNTPEQKNESVPQPTAPPSTDPPTPDVTEPEIIITSNTCYGQVYERLYTERMYCFIADTSSNIYGDSDLFSDQHLATVESDENGWITVSYNPDDYGILSEPNTYRYAFYNDEGAIVYSDSAYFGASENTGEGGEE